MQTYEPGDAQAPPVVQASGASGQTSLRAANRAHDISAGFLRSSFSPAETHMTPEHIRSQVAPSVSVVIPVKDDAVFLLTCLKSKQTVPAPEIIVVDNGSTDDSTQIARRFGARVVTEDRPGIAAASATGYDTAVGDIVARLDSDSVPPDTWVQGITTAFLERTTVDVFTGPADFGDGPHAWRRLASRVYLGSYFATATLALSHPPIFGSNFAMRRAAWEAVRRGIHADDDMVHDDFDLAFHIGRHHRIRYLPEMRVGISMRPLLEGGGALRARRGLHTVFIHWPLELPSFRLARRHLLPARQEATGDQVGRHEKFQVALGVDLAGVLALAGASLILPIDNTLRRIWLGTATVGLSTWFLAAIAGTLSRAAIGDQARARQLLKEAARWVRTGWALNSLGTAALLVKSTNLELGNRRLGVAGAGYLLVGGAVISAAYDTILRSARKSARHRGEAPHL